jgi:4-amino-4-deoxy-L-arabinose transferase-like glycosyltransferase
MSSTVIENTAAENSGFVGGAAGITLMAFVMRIYGIGQQEIWLDEAASFHKASMPQWLGDVALNENTPPLYYLLLRAWLLIASWSDASLRMPSAIFGTLFVLTVIYVGKEVFDQKVGLWSGFWAAVNPNHIYYCQEARAYSLLALTIVLTYLTISHAIKVNTWSRWALVSMCMLLSLYGHYSAILGLIPTILMVLPNCKVKPQIGLRYGVALLMSILLFVPWYLGSFVMKSHSWAGTAWIPYVWDNTPPLWAIPKTLEVFAFGSHAGFLPIPLKQYTHLEYSESLRFIGLTGLVGMAIWLAAPWREHNWGIPQLPMRKLWLGVQLLFPLFVLWFVSFYKPIYVSGRYDFVAFPAFPLLLGLAFAKVQMGTQYARILAPLTGMILVVPIGTKLFMYYKADSPRPNEEIARTIDAYASEGDVVIFSGLRRNSVIYYLHHFGFRWENDHCVSEAAGRNIFCPLFPQGAALYVTVNDARGNVRDMVNGLTSKNALWVICGYSNVRTGKVQLESSEKRLLGELEQAGFIRSGAPWQPGILKFHQHAG